MVWSNKPVLFRVQRLQLEKNLTDRVYWGFNAFCSSCFWWNLILRHVRTSFKWNTEIGLIFWPLLLTVNACAKCRSGGIIPVQHYCISRKNVIRDFHIKCTSIDFDIPIVYLIILNNDKYNLFSYFVNG